MKKNSGFTLIEVAIVLLIGGILLSSASALLLTYMKKVQISTTEKRLEAIQDAMQLFLNLNGRYPCPADPADGLDTADFGVEQPIGGVSCTTPTTAGRGGRNIVYGSIPVRTLNLPDDFIGDAWGGRFSYAVTKALAETGTFNRTEGAITIVDRNNNPVVRDPADAAADPGVVQYTIVSHGKNNSGATSLDGQQISACVPAVQEGENCNNDDTFRSTLLVSGAMDNNYNDDIVRYRAITAFGEWIPAGAVMAFNLAACPDGWNTYAAGDARFIVGSGATYALGATGGDATVALTNAQIGYQPSATGIVAAAIGAGGTSFGQSLGVAATAHQNLPPYVALLYCEKS